MKKTKWWILWVALMIVIAVIGMRVIGDVPPGYTRVNIAEDRRMLVPKGWYSANEDGGYWYCVYNERGERAIIPVEKVGKTEDEEYILYESVQYGRILWKSGSALKSIDLSNRWRSVTKNECVLQGEEEERELWIITGVGSGRDLMILDESLSLEQISEMVESISDHERGAILL